MKYKSGLASCKEAVLKVKFILAWSESMYFLSFSFSRNYGHTNLCHTFVGYSAFVMRKNYVLIVKWYCLSAQIFKVHFSHVVMSVSILGRSVTTSNCQFRGHKIKLNLNKVFTISTFSINNDLRLSSLTSWLMWWDF